MSDVSIRLARADDTPKIQYLHNLSVQDLCSSHYSPIQIKASLETFMPVDPGLAASGTYYLAEVGDTLVASGGWTPAVQEVGLARIRAVYVHPDWVRRGLGRSLVTQAEDAARMEGVKRFVVNSSLNAVPFYSFMGYRVVSSMELDLGRDITFPIVQMEKHCKK